MEVTKNKIKVNKDGKPVRQEVTWKDSTGSYTGKYERKGGRTILTEIEQNRK